MPPGWPWKAPIGPIEGGKDRTRPWNHASDRQVAFFELHNVTQGVYVCANHGNCTAPDVCRCEEGWGGFDCRTPICTQGYYFPEQEKFVSGTEKTTELQISTGRSIRTCLPTGETGPIATPISC